jgi:hypothetical protein
VHFQELQRAQEELLGMWLRLMMTPLPLNFLEIITTPQSNVLLIKVALLRGVKLQTLYIAQKTIYLSILSRKRASRRNTERRKHKYKS